MMDTSEIRKIADDDGLLEVARLAIEDVLVEMRDERISCPYRRNGLVIRERDGTDSSTIRMGSEIAVRIALKAIANHIDAQVSSKSVR